MKGEINNSTGGSFPASMYAEATFVYLLEAVTNNSLFTYAPVGSTTGKCNIMGYWHTGNVGISTVPDSRIRRDTAICTDKCIGDIGTILCGNDSMKYPRFDKNLRVPLIDVGASDAALSTVDYDAFPDLHVFPSIAGAVVPIFNIKELTGLVLVLSRATIASIFKLDIKYWNDDRILNDNMGKTKSILSNLGLPINVVVRTDSSGTTSIFSSALSSFDPSIGASADNSFAATIGASTTPTWCGPLTDEIQKLTVTNCTIAQTSSQRLVTLSVKDLAFVMRSLSFDCNATAVQVQSQFNTILGSDSVIVTRSNPTSTSTVFSIGYWYSPVNKRNMYEPFMLSSGSTAVSVATVQEGGFLNSHYNSSAYFVTIESQSIFVNILYNASFTVTYTAPTGTTFASAVINPATGNTAQILLAALNALYSGLAVTSVTRSFHFPSPWVEYVVVFSTATPSLLGVTVTNAAMAGQVTVMRFLKGKNYPLFYDGAHPLGLSGSGRYTCYRNQDKMAPWSYFTGNLNPGVCALVR